MEARRAHNPEVVGSSPASATIKIPGIHYEYRDFSNFFGFFENAENGIIQQKFNSTQNSRLFQENVRQNLGILLVCRFHDMGVNIGRSGHLRVTQAL